MASGTTGAYLRLADDVRAALADGTPVVALESTVISHGLPYPQNVEAALAMEAVIRAEDAVPATIALLDGWIRVGLSRVEIERLGQGEVLKASRRDLSVALAKRLTAATTVAGTLACAALAGIRVFATGGIGGVHRGAPESFDISADLHELARTQAITVCAGIKAILDLPLTLEYLETQGVPVIGFQTNEMPAFYCQTSGLLVPHRADTAEQVAQIATAQWQSGLGGGLLVACPIPEPNALPAGLVEGAIATALGEAERRRLQGPAVTPFILRRLAELTNNQTLVANRALLVNNALWAARFARALIQQA